MISLDSSSWFHLAWIWVNGLNPYLCAGPDTWKELGRQA